MNPEGYFRSETKIKDEINLAFRFISILVFLVKLVGGDIPWHFEWGV